MTATELDDTATGSDTRARTADWVTLSTPDGPFTVIADDAGRVLASGWTDDPGYLAVLVSPSLRPATLRAGRDLSAITDAVTAYYDGDHEAPDAVEVVQRSGPFLDRAWEALRTVRPGEPVTYTALAALAGGPLAVRAAASSCARNAAALFVPCHRVLRSDGTLGGFRYGLEIKQSLLNREALDREA